MDDVLLFDTNQLGCAVEHLGRLSGQNGRSATGVRMMMVVMVLLVLMMVMRMFGRRRRVIVVEA